MSLSFLNTQGFQTSSPKTNPTLDPIFQSAVDLAKTTFASKLNTLGLSAYAESVWNAFNIEGIPETFHYESLEFKAFKVLHKGASYQGGFLNVCHGNDALAELMFGLLCLAFEEALAIKPPLENVPYSIFVERSNTNWSQVQNGNLTVVKSSVLKNTYNVFRIFVTPKVGSRGMSPAQLYGCKQLQQPQQPQQVQSQQPQQPQQFQPQQPQQFQVGAAKNESEEPIPF